MGMPEFCIIEDGGDATYVSIPRGGPIYVPDMVGPLTRVPDFESVVFHQLQDLKAEVEELSSDLLEPCGEDISRFNVGNGLEFSDVLDDRCSSLGIGRARSTSLGPLQHRYMICEVGDLYALLGWSGWRVDELKIITEEELVNKAFKEAFKDGEVGHSSQVPEEHVNAGRKDDSRISSHEHACSESSERERDASTSIVSSNGSPLRTGDNRELIEDTLKKRKRKRHMNQKRHTLNGSYIAKVEQLARIKQKQDENKAAARLHSFNGSCRINESASIFSEKNERVTSLKSISSSTKVRSSNTREHVPLLYPDVSLCVEVYHNRRTSAKTQEFLVLGRQFLTELRDKIYCLTDEVMKKAEQHDSSGYFLIEDLFCNDLRESSAIDYSEPILNWLKNSKNEALEKWECIVSGELQQKQKSILGSDTEPQLPKFKAVDMHQMRFCDLKFRLGAGYLYCHQGDCKHIIVIRDMRLIHPEDVQNRAAYPLVTFQVKLRFRKCSVCKIYRAEKVTIDDKWATEHPCYFCDLCYYMLHYENGSLLYNDFSVYDYHHE